MKDRKGSRSEAHSAEAQTRWRVAAEKRREAKQRRAAKASSRVAFVAANARRARNSKLLYDVKIFQK
jgi:hypothetical protein